MKSWSNTFRLPHRRAPYVYDPYIVNSNFLASTKSQLCLLSKTNSPTLGDRLPDVWPLVWALDDGKKWRSWGFCKYILVFAGVRDDFSGGGPLVVTTLGSSAVSSGLSSKRSNLSVRSSKRFWCSSRRSVSSRYSCCWVNVSFWLIIGQAQTYFRYILIVNN